MGEDVDIYTMRRLTDQLDELEAYQEAIEKLLTGEPQVPLSPREWQALWAPARRLTLEMRKQVDPPQSVANLSDVMPGPKDPLDHSR